MGSETAKASRLSESILELEFLIPDITLVKSEVEVGWNLAKKLNPEKNLFVLLTTAPWSLLDAEARDFAMHEMKTWPAVAVLVHSTGQKILGQVASKLMGQSSRIKFFENRQKAIHWLLNHT